MFLFFITHILGCIWIHIGRNTDPDVNWIVVSEKDYANVHPTDNINMYIIAVYWVVTTLTTVGYGDFKGYN
jgi:hypothetical protein